MVRAPAKINLVLEVLGKRQDGYHELKSIMQTINLYDILTFDRSVDIEIDCNIPDVKGKDNLVYKAIELMKTVTGNGEGVKVYIQKNIPVSAGLGGGSSDAAATLLALNYLWDLKFKRSELARLAENLGSDIPFFLFGGTASVEGKGEKVRSIRNINTTWFVIFLPDFNLPIKKTAMMYSKLKQTHYSQGQFYKNMMDSIIKDGRISENELYNVFESVVDEVFDNISSFADVFIKAGISRVNLCGAGPALYCLTENRRLAQRVYDILSKSYKRVFLVKSIKRLPKIIWL